MLGIDSGITVLSRRSSREPQILNRSADLLVVLLADERKLKFSSGDLTTSERELVQ